MSLKTILALALLCFSTNVLAQKMPTRQELWDAIPAPSIQVKEDCERKTCLRFVEFNGQIRPDSASELQKVVSEALRKNESIKLVRFNSLGGDLKSGLIMGQYIRSIGWNTEVAPGQSCVSSCFYAFIGGEKRTLSPTSVVGVHMHFPIPTPDSYGDVPLVSLSEEAKNLIYNTYGLETKNKAHQHYILFVGDLYKVSQSALRSYQLVDYQIENLNINHKVSQLILGTPFFKINAAGTPEIQACYIRPECFSTFNLDNTSKKPNSTPQQCETRNLSSTSLAPACK